MVSVASLPQVSCKSSANSLDSLLTYSCYWKYLHLVNQQISKSVNGPSEHLEGGEGNRGSGGSKFVIVHL